MKNKNTKSMTTHVKRKLVLATCLVLAALGLSAAQLQAQGRGSPPTPADFTFIQPNTCSFDVLVQVTAKAGTIFLPGGDVLITSPATFATFTNLSDTTKSVTLSLNGPIRVSPVQNGIITIRLTGRGILAFPNVGFRFLIGDWTFLIDANTGQPLQPPTGTGQNIDLCGLID